MTERQSFGDAALERAKRFIYRLDKKAVLDPVGACSQPAQPLPVYVPSSLGSSTNLFTLKPLPKPVHQTRIQVRDSIRQRCDSTTDDNGDSDDTELEERILHLEQRLIALEQKTDQILQLLETSV